MAAMVAVCELSLDAVKATTHHVAPPLPAATARGIAAWMRRHRLTLRPWTVEAETVGLFLGPLLLRGGALAALEWSIAAVYVVFVAVDVILMARAFATSEASSSAGGSASS